MSRILLTVAMLGAVLISAAGHAGELRRPAGRVALTIDVTVPAGGGSGTTWHKGILTLLDGSKHTYAVSGIWVQGGAGSLVDLEGKAQLKRRSLLGYGALVGEHGRLVRQRWISGQPAEDKGLLDAPELGPVVDTLSIYEAVEGIRPVPLGKQSVVAIVAPALLPMIPVAAIECR